MSRDTENIKIFENIGLNNMASNNITTNPFNSDSLEQSLTKKKGRIDNIR